MVENTAGKIVFAQIDSVLAAGFCEADSMTFANIIPAQIHFDENHPKMPPVTICTAVEFFGAQ